MGDSDNGKVQKTSQKAFIKGKDVFWEIAGMVKYTKNSPKALIKGKVAFWEIAQMVKYKKLLQRH